MNIPEGHQAVMPYLMLDDAAGFIQFIKDVFDAEIHSRACAMASWATARRTSAAVR